MSKVAEAARSEEFPPDLFPQPCYRCARIVVYAHRSPVREHGTRPVAIERVPPGSVGHVAIETNLAWCGGYGPAAYETNLPTRYRWHGPGCELIGITPRGGA